MDPQQKDLLCHRFTVNRITGRFEYRLYNDKKKTDTKSTDKEYKFAVISMTNGILKIDSLHRTARDLENKYLEDRSNFIVPVINI
jgi:hypothetical protein